MANNTNVTLEQNTVIILKSEMANDESTSNSFLHNWLEKQQSHKNEVRSIQFNQQ